MNAAYDAGVLVAADRNESMTWLKHRRRLQRGFVPLVTAPVVAQVSRSPRQVHLRRFLASCRVVDFTGADAHAVGELLARSNTSDVTDAHLVLTASRADARVVTSDVDDIERLMTAVERPVPVERA